jgi:hypothetical protein
LLSHASYPAGCYEVAVAATTANGFASGNTYGVFCTLAVDSQNPTGSIGSFSLEPIISDLREMGGVAQSATDLKDFADAGYDPGTNKVQGVVLVDTTTTNTDMRGTDSAATAANYTAVRAGYLDNINGHTAQTGDSFARLGAPAGASVSADIAAIKTVADAIDSVTGLLRVKKNTAINNFPIPMVLSTDHASAATGLSVTCQRSIDGAAYANCNTVTATEIGSGDYKINLTASDLNGDVIILKFTATGADDTKFIVLTVP